MMLGPAVVLLLPRARAERLSVVWTTDLGGDTFTGLGEFKFALAGFKLAILRPIAGIVTPMAAVLDQVSVSPS